jgi:hypothetical protein
MEINLKKFNKILLWISIIYTGFYIIYFSFVWGLGFSLTYNQLNNLLTLGMFVIPTIPILWFQFIKLIWLRILTSVLYVLVLIPVALVSFLAFFFTLYDVLEWKDNGFRPVYEKQLEKRNWLIVFRTPDQGALGGDHIRPALVDKIIPGVQKRKWLNETDIKVDINNDSNYIEINNQKYRVPKDTILRQFSKIK